LRIYRNNKTVPLREPPPEQEGRGTRTHTLITVWSACGHKMSKIEKANSATNKASFGALPAASLPLPGAQG
jgi:hypothetical protein